MRRDIDEIIAEGFKTARVITKAHAKTFYFASRFLAKEKQDAAYAIYSACRISDHSVDSGAQANRQARLTEVAEKIERAYSHAPLPEPLLISFRRTVHTYAIPKAYFDGLIAGMRMDLEKSRYATFDELYTYCYRAAGVVGLIMIKIFGAGGAEAEKHAVELGVAMQLTNILRDIKEDYAMGRVYLPQDEMRRFGVDESTLSRREVTTQFRELMRFEIERARRYYTGSAAGIALITDPASRRVVTLMKDMYAGILDQIEKHGYDVFSRRAYVPALGKAAIALKILSQKAPR